MSGQQRRYKRIAAALGVAFFVLYAVTAAPSIVELYDDTLEFQLVAPTFGIAHPTGYPLYTLLGGLWSRLLLPIGNWAWRMNLFSALAAAGTVALLFLFTVALTQKVVPTKAQSTSTIVPGIIAALAFGLSPIWWSQATIAEVYALHNLLVILALLPAVALADTSLPSGKQRVTALALVIGLGLAHHRMIVLLGPGLLLLLAGERWIWQPSRHWARWVPSLLAPLLLYLYIPLRAAMGVHDLNGSYVNTWDGFWHHILALGYTSFFTENVLTQQLSAIAWAELWWRQYGAVALILGLAGVVWALVRGSNRRLTIAMIVVLLTNTGFALAYRVGDPEVFMITAWLTFAPWIGLALVALHQLVQHRWTGRMLQALVLFWLLIGIDGRNAPVNRSQDWAIHDYAVALAKVDFPPESRLIGLEGQITALRYMQAAEGFGENAIGIVANDPVERAAIIASAVHAGYPVYLTQEVEGIAEHYSFSGDGPLVRVWPRGEAQVKRADHALELAMANDQLTLLGYDLFWLEEAGGSGIRGIFYWQPHTQLDAVYKVSIRLLGGDDQPLRSSTGEALTADRFPLRQVAPTTTWLPGEVVSDVYDLSLGGNSRDVVQTLQVILYDAATVAEVGSVRIPLNGG